ncbi:MAG: Holliday junction branch migration protein RuvA [Patescibacteria group bacterium]|jgi:Holliday junction DNA helicase RuvA
MIAYLTGTIFSRTEESVVLLVSGIGYDIHMLSDIAVGDLADFYIYDWIREDRHELYGFETIEEKKMFEQLLTISGVGAKMAQKLMRAGSPDRLFEALQKQDLDFFQSIPGIGKKMAQKILLELKGVLVSGEAVSEEDTETLEALIHLGYARKDCKEILSSLHGENQEERIREALKLLSHS